MHTPGPWIADDVFVGTKTAERFHVTCRGEHAEADAALIAAAPDLLAALRIARDHVNAAAESDLFFARMHDARGMQGSAANCRKDYVMRLAALHVIDAAIAKAIEGQP